MTSVTGNWRRFGKALVRFCMLALAAVGAWAATVAPIWPALATQPSEYAVIDLPPADARGASDVNMRAQWQYLPRASKTVSPDAVWQLPASAFKVQDTERTMHLDEHSSYVARMRFQQPASGSDFYINVPVPHLDTVRLWYRTPGQPAWRMAMAGAAVPRNLWAIPAAYPSFQLPGSSPTVDVVMAFGNAESLWVNVVAQSTMNYHSNRSTYSSGAGTVLGMLAAVFIGCLFALQLARIEFVFISLLCLSGFFLSVARTGIGYISYWPDAPRFNVSSSILFQGACVIFTMLTIHALMPAYPWRRTVQKVVWVLAFLGVCAVAYGYAVPAHASRAIATYAAVTMGLTLILPLSMLLLRSDRVSAWISGALMFAVLSATAEYISRYLATPIDGYGIASGVFFVLGMLCLLSAALGRYQYGHSALSDKVGIDEDVDALTGLLNPKGFAHSMSLTALAAGRKRELSPVVTLFMCRLPAVESEEYAQYGKTVVTQAEVRLAAALKQGLSDAAVVARLQAGCFAAFTSERVTAQVVESSATKILSTLLKAEGLPNFVSELGLQILIAQVPCRRLSASVFGAMHTYGQQHEDERRTIHWVDIFRPQSEPSAPVPVAPMRSRLPDEVDSDLNEGGYPV